MKKPDTILIIQTAFLGDVILATALVEKLSGYFPQSKIDFLVRAGNEGIVSSNPHIRKVLVWEKRESKYRNLLKLLFDIRKSKYDLVVNVQRFANTGFLTVFSGASYTTGFDKNPFSAFFSRRAHHQVATEGRTIHETERNQELISWLTDETPAKPRIYPDEQAKTSVSGYQPAPYICIAPASVWFTKQYPEENWKSLLNLIPEAIRVFLIGGKEDIALCERLKAGCGGQNVTNLAGKLNLMQSAALIGGARTTICNDSGPLHLATAMNAPVCAIYCSTVPAFGFGPLSDSSTIVEVEERLDCRPCGLHGHAACPKGHFKCGKDIRPGHVFQQVEPYL